MNTPITWEISHKTLFCMFAAAYFLGVTAGMIGEIFRFQRAVFPLKKVWQGIVTGVGDFLLLLGLAISACILLYALNFGRFRPEVPLLQLLGFISWKKVGDTVLKPFYDRLSGKIKKNRRIKNERTRKSDPCDRIHSGTHRRSVRRRHDAYEAE